MMHCAQKTCTGGTATGGCLLQYKMAARVRRRPYSLASFFTTARQLVSEVESCFSSDKDGNPLQARTTGGSSGRGLRDSLCCHSAIGGLAIEQSKPKQPGNDSL